MFSYVAILFALGVPRALVGAQSVDPNTIPIGTRTTWCTSQRGSCPILCSQLDGESADTLYNSCDPETLAFECLCGNGQYPNASEYSETIPYYLCTVANNQCVDRCAGSSTCQSSCREDNPCGAKNPTRVNTSTISTMAATATASGADADNTGDAIYTGFGASATAGSSSGGTNNAGRTAVDLGRSYGLAVVATGIFAGFAFLL